MRLFLTLCISRFGGNGKPQLGDRVEVKVLAVDKERKRINLALERIL